ncbi:protein GET1-like isoform X2 [Salvia miltiorrhiza]|uniref:protein GET1-like isoform X2 n=1 Tax=Salvia miltiorrhiza TaxID=226208 RepID=UPI0025ABE4B5|nr:protein GET1-like isoform X2 [Salvia miltiorrhiza]
MEEIQTGQGKSFAAPVIFILVFSFLFVSKYIESQKNKVFFLFFFFGGLIDFAFQFWEKGSGENLDVRLRQEIKQLLKEANSLSQPSTFAQAVKLRRTAAAKEKELAKLCQVYKLFQIILFLSNPEMSNTISGLDAAVLTLQDLEMQEKDMKLSVSSYGKHLMISKVFTYFVLILWFWKIPVATIPDQLVHPFGRLLSWRAGTSLKDSVVEGIRVRFSLQGKF